MSVKLVDSFIRTAPVGDHYDSITAGLILRAGKKTTSRLFQLRARDHTGSYKRIDIGQWKNPATGRGEVSLGEARADARRKQAELIHAPIAPEPETGSITLRELLDRRRAFVAVAPSTKNRRNMPAPSALVAIARVEREFKAHLDMSVRKLAVADVAAVKQRIISEKKPGLWRTVRSGLHSALTWAAEHGHVDKIVTTMVASVASGSRVERVLSMGEIRRVWQATYELEAQARQGSARRRNGHPSEASLCRVTRFILLTGVRRQEAVGLRYREVIGGRLRLLPERTKQYELFELPLPRLALDQLGTGTALELCFPGERPGVKISQFMNTMDKLRKLSGVDFTWHDLRRTLMSHMVQKLGVAGDVADAIIGHKNKTVSAVGSKHYLGPVPTGGADDVLIAAALGDIIDGDSLLRRKGEALQRYADYIERIVAVQLAIAA